MGLGDALYVQAVARHLVRQGYTVEVCSKWPEVFIPLGDRVTVTPFRRTGIDRLAHYSMRRPLAATDQFEDCCLQAGIPEPVALRLDWQENPAWRARLRAANEYDLPVVVLPLPRAPMDRRDGFGAELLPNCHAIQKAIDSLRSRTLVVQVGQGRALHQFKGIDLDFANRTSVCDLIDIVACADLCLGYVSFLVPLAASLGKPALFVWSRRGLNSPHELIRWLTPRKVLHGEGLASVIDDAPDDVIAEAADALLEQIGCARAA